MREVKKITKKRAYGPWPLRSWTIMSCPFCDKETHISTEYYEACGFKCSRGAFLVGDTAERIFKEEGKSDDQINGRQ